jgi:hypothetical protein
VPRDEFGGRVEATNALFRAFQAYVENPSGIQNRLGFLGCAPWTSHHEPHFDQPIVRDIHVLADSRGGLGRPNCSPLERLLLSTWYSSGGVAGLILNMGDGACRLLATNTTSPKFATDIVIIRLRFHCAREMLFIGSTLLWCPKRHGADRGSIVSICVVWLSLGVRCGLSKESWGIVP